MKSERKPVEIFSFSFLDVIACGVGVILFITILLITQAAAKRDPELMRELSEAHADIRTLQQMQDEYQENQQKQQEKQQVTQELAQLRAHAASLRQQAELATAYAALKKEYDAAKDALSRVQAASQQLKGRAPVARESDKRPSVSVAFQGNGVVRVVYRNYGEYLTDDYTVTDLGDETILKSRGEGRNLHQTLQPGGTLRRMIQQMDLSAEFIECYVESDAFEDFVNFRDVMQQAGIEIGYMFISDTSVLGYARTGRSARVQ